MNILKVHQLNNIWDKNLTWYVCFFIAIQLFYVVMGPGSKYFDQGGLGQFLVARVRSAIHGLGLENIP